MKKFLKGNWCCFQVLGDLDPFLVRFFEVERGGPSFRLAIRCQRYVEYIWIFHEYINIRDRILLKNYHKFSSSKLNLANLFLGTPKGRVFLGHST